MTIVNRSQWKTQWTAPRATRQKAELQREAERIGMASIRMLPDGSSL